jgi:N-acetylneuraminate synthase
MATLEEIEHAVKILKNSGCDNLTLLHCVSSYPSPHQESNLSAIEAMRNLFNCEVGWSDHSFNSGVLYRSIFKWNASAIEFHIDLEGEGEEFSSGHCWLPNQIAEVIKNIDYGFESDGDGVKVPADCESIERVWRADPSDGLRPLLKTRKNY